MLEKWHLDANQLIPEYIDLIHCQDGQTFASSLILLGSDFAILLILPVEVMAHTNLPSHIDQQKGAEKHV